MEEGEATHSVAIVQEGWTVRLFLQKAAGLLWAACLLLAPRFLLVTDIYILLLDYCILLFSSPISCMYGLCMDQPLTTLSLSLLDPRLCNCNTPLISPPLQPDTGQQEARGSLKEELCCCCRCFVSNVNVCLCVSEAARVSWRSQETIFSTGLLSLDSQGGRD